MYQMCIRTIKITLVYLVCMSPPYWLSHRGAENLVPEPLATRSVESCAFPWADNFHFFPVLLFSPEEFIDNPIDNLSITKNSKKMQKAVRGRQRPSPSYYSSLCQAMKLLAGLHIDIHNSDALRPCGFTNQVEATNQSHHII